MSKKKTEEIKVKKFGNMLIINGKIYEPSFDMSKDNKDGEYLKFKKIDDKEYLRKVDTIARKLAPKLDSLEVMKNALGELPTKNLDKIYDSLFIKKKKTRTRQRHGCYEMLVAGETIPIR